jgi:hypothetical protein
MIVTKIGKILPLLIVLISTEIGIASQENFKLVLLDPSKKQLIVPLKNISSEYLDNQSKLPEIEFSDSYYSQISDQILFNEISKSFKSVELLSDTDVINRLYSAINQDSIKSADADSLKVLIREIIDKYKVDFLVIPIFCKLKFKTVHQNNWRDGKGGSSYERPVSISAFAEYHIQFYQKDGNLSRESKGDAKTGKPLMYSFFKKKNLNKDVVNNSKKKYAPPLLRALHKAITNAVKNI